MNVETAGQKLKQIRIRSRKSIDEIIKLARIPYDVYIGLEHNELGSSDKGLIDKLSRALGCRDTDILKG